MSQKYRTIVADPPWEYGMFGGFNQSREGVRHEVRRTLPYPSMSVAEIAAIRVREFAYPDGANVFLWTTNRHLPSAFQVLTSWGAAYSQTLVWHKTGANPTTGYIAPTSCEFLLYARIGSPSLSGRLPDSLLTTKRLANRHSAKPEVWLDLIESIAAPRYLELFARRQRLGWDTWGNEALEHVSLVAQADGE